MSSDQRDQVIAYLGEEWPLIRDSMSEDEHDAFLQATAGTIGFKAWALSGSHDNAVTRTIRGYQDRIFGDKPDPTPGTREERAE